MQPIWTIGHSTRKIDTFISLLEENGIKLLIDVRTLPGSKRYPQFNKEMLAKSLQEHGIHYEHFGALGGRRKPRPDSHNIAWRNASFRGYADYMETEEFGKGVKRLVDLANESGTTVIMCAEAVWWRCHRSLISDYLKVRGIEVIHILDANKTEPHPFTPAARIVGGTLSYASDRDRLI
ncbi:MAG: Fe-S cluster assembly protein HesB [Verrucomicrobia bacterium]|nr:MAG: Fe-S cluster assembly protein HesB [Verrucomicrobiota bacterium]